MKNDIEREPIDFSSAKQEAVELFKRGLGYKAVARQLGLSANTVRDWGRKYRNGTLSIQSQRGRRFISEEEAEVRAQAAAYAAEGRTPAEIAKRLGILESRCRRWIQSDLNRKPPL